MICHLVKYKDSRNYHARIRLPHEAKTHEISLHCTNKQVAQKKMQSLYEELEREASGIVAPKSLRDAAQKPLRIHLEEMISEKAAMRDERYLDGVRLKVVLLESECKWSSAKDVTPDSFLKWRRERRSNQGVSPKTLNEYLGAIRALLNWMVKRNRLGENPLRSVELLATNGEQVKPRRAFTDEEMQKLLNVAGERKIVYLIAVETGLRNGEVRALRVGDVHLDDGNPRIEARASTTKNGKAAIIPLRADLAEQLREYFKDHPLSPPDSLFGGVFWKRRQFRYDLKAAGIPLVDNNGLRVDFHSLRHTFCTNLQRGGTGQRVLMELMRHSDRRLSDYLYTDAALLPVREALKTLPNYSRELPHILPHDLVPESPNESRRDKDIASAIRVQAPTDTALGHVESLKVPSSPYAEKIGATGFEPATSWSQTKRSTKLSYAPNYLIMNDLNRFQQPSKNLLVYCLWILQNG